MVYKHAISTVVPARNIKMPVTPDDNKSLDSSSNSGNV